MYRRFILAVLVAAAGSGCAAASRPSSEGPRTAGAGTMVDRLPVLHATIDGKPVSLLLDTGASITCLRHDAIERLGRAPVGISSVSGAGDTTRGVSTYGPALLAIGAVSTAIRSLHGCPTLSLLGTRGRAIDGVIGGDALHGLAVVIDYPAGRVHVRAPAPPVAADSAATVPIAFVRALPIVTVELRSDGRWQPVTLLLDTGADASLLLGAEAAAGIDLEPDPMNVPVERHGLGGAIETRSFHLPRARIGSIEVREVAVEVVATGLSQLFDDRLQGIVGGGFLQHFRVELDLGNARMRLAAPGADPSLCGSRSGICLASRAAGDGYLIESVRPRSHAARHHIVRGEILTHVGAAPAARMSPAEVRAALRPATGLVTLWVRSAFGRLRRVDMRIVD